MARTELLIYGLTVVGYAVATAVVIVAYWQSGNNIQPPPAPIKARRRTPTYAGRLLLRVALTTLLLFFLPPFGGDPPGWQIAITLLAWIALSYRCGLWGRGRWLWSAAEAAPLVGLSVVWTHLLVVAGHLAIGI